MTFGYSVSSQPLEELVRAPESAFEADCERIGAQDTSEARMKWLAGVRRGLLSVQNGGYWWQALLVGLAEDASRRWHKAVMRIGGAARRAEMTEDDRDAGRIQYTASAIRTIRDALFQMHKNRTAGAAAGYAWTLWRASVATGLRIWDLRTARLSDKGHLVDRANNILLHRISKHAREEVLRMVQLRDSAVGPQGENSLYAQAEQVWEEAARKVPPKQRPSLASARHLSIAVWRKDLDNPLLAVLLEEDEYDVAVWGQELHPSSELAQHQPPVPPRRPKAVQAGYTLVEMVIVIAVLLLLAGASLSMASARIAEARRITAVQSVSGAAQAAALIPDRSRYTWQSAAVKALGSIGQFEVSDLVGLSSAVDVTDLGAGAYIGQTTTGNTSRLQDENSLLISIPDCPVGRVQVILFPDGMAADHPLAEADAGWLILQLELNGFTAAGSNAGIAACLRE